MDFTPDRDQADLRATARRYLDDRWPPGRVAELATAGRDRPAELDPRAWAELGRQGWLDDLGPTELGLLATEAGRALLPAPWWSTAAALPVYRAAGRPPPGPVTLADTAGRGDVAAARSGPGWRLDGRVELVVDAGTAAEIVVAAGTGSGPAFFAVTPGGEGVAMAGLAGLDASRGLSDLALTGAPARLLRPAAPGEPAALGDRAAVLLACEAVGVAERALELAVAHATVRVQFGRPIGSQQAVAHRLADAYAELETTRSLAHRAAHLLGTGADPASASGAADAADARHCAVHAARHAALEVCEIAIQVFGGTGLTWEHPLHWWFRRALWLDAWHARRPDPLVALAGAMLG